MAVTSDRSPCGKDDEARLTSGLGRFDHVALEVSSLDEMVCALVSTAGMRLVRTGVLSRTGQRIAMLGDGTGVKIELIESADVDHARLSHVAFRCENVGGALSELSALGWRKLFGPHELSAAKAETALLEGAQHLRLQVIKYEQASPDIAEWSVNRSTES